MNAKLLRGEDEITREWRWGRRLAGAKAVEGERKIGGLQWQDRRFCVLWMGPAAERVAAGAERARGRRRGWWRLRAQ